MKTNIKLSGLKKSHPRISKIYWGKYIVRIFTDKDMTLEITHKEDYILSFSNSNKRFSTQKQLVDYINNWK